MISVNGVGGKYYVVRDRGQPLRDGSWVYFKQVWDDEKQSWETQGTAYDDSLTAITKCLEVIELED